jgi:hypothetical protein
MFLMLARLEMVADEPVTPAAHAPVLDRAGLDRRSINRKAVRLWPVIRDYLIDRSGRSLICHLDPAFVPSDPNRGRPYGVPDPRPKIQQLRGPSPYELDGGPGSWQDVGTGKQGPDCISIIEMLGNCSRDVATNYLRDLVDRLVEFPK